MLQTFVLCSSCVTRKKALWSMPLGALMLLSVMPSATAGPFLESYDRSISNDKQYAVISAQTAAAREAIPQARARLLPQLSWTSTRYQVDQSRKDASRTYPDQSYRSESDGVVLRQPIYQPRLWAGLRQTESAVEAAEASFDQERQGVLLRLFERFLDLALARERINLVSAQQRSAEGQYSAARKALAAGAGTRTDLLEVQAQLDRIRASALQAKQAELIANAQLGLMVGQPLSQAPVFIASALNPDDLDLLSLQGWIEGARQGSFELASQQAKVNAAQQALRAAGYEHFPSLDLVGQAVRSSSEETLLINSETRTTSLGFSLSIPIYQGGAISSKQRQLQANLLEAQERLDLVTNQLTVEVSKSFFALKEGMLMVQALEKALASNNEALLANQKSLLAGVRRALDVLSAEQRVFQTQLDLQTARMQTLLAWVRLRSFTGNANRDLAQRLDGFFKYDELTTTFLK